MTKAARQLKEAHTLLKFKSAEEFGRFVETHDMSRFIESAPLLRDKLGTGHLRAKLVRFPADVLRTLNRVAPRFGLDSTNLIRFYVIQGLRKDLASSK